jgi:hypothetical protein
MGMIFLRNRVSGAAPADAYAIGGASPELVAAFLTAADGTTEGEYFRTGGVEDDFSMFTFARSGLATMFDSTGTLVWAPHNVLQQSADLTNAYYDQTPTGATISTSAEPAPFFGETMFELAEDTSLASQHRFDVTSDFNTTFPAGSTVRIGIFVKPFGSLTTCDLRARSGADFEGNAYAFFTLTGDGSVLSSGPDNVNEGIEKVPGTDVYYIWMEGELHPDGAGTSFRPLLRMTDGTNAIYDGRGSGTGLYIWGYHVCRTDLGGMADNPDIGYPYVPTTSAAVYLSRRNAYYYDSGWTRGGLQLESAAATQLLHGTDSFATQDETVTAQDYTLQFRGTGSITLSGAHSATLTGTGANDLVYLTFTPSAGTLTLTPSGTVDYPQLEVGIIPTSYIPNTAGSGTVTRAAETLSIAGADTPFNTTAFTIFGDFTSTIRESGGPSADTNFFNWALDASNRVSLEGDVSADHINARHRFSGTNEIATASGALNDLSDGVLARNRACATWTSSAVYICANGVTGENLNPLGMPALGSADCDVADDKFNGFISDIRMWGTNIGADGRLELAP